LKEKKFLMQGERGRKEKQKGLPLGKESDGERSCDPEVGSLIGQAQRMSLTGGVSEAIELYKKVVAIAGRRNLSRERAIGLRKLGALWGRKGDTKKAMTYLRKSAGLAEKSGDVLECAKAYNGIGALYFNSGEWEKVKEFFTLAMDAAEKTGDLSLMANIFNNLGAMSNILGDWEMAISYYERSIVIYKELGDVIGLARNYNNLGLTYRDRGDWEKAASYYLESESLASGIGDVSLKANCALNYAQVLLQLSRLDEAREKCDEAYESLTSTGESGSIAEAMMLYGMIYTKMEKWALAERHFEESVTMNESHGNLLGLAECYREMALLYKNWGQSRKTLECLGKSFTAFKSLKAIRYLQDINSKMAELEDLTFKITRDMGAAVESKDTYTFGHSQRVAHYAMEIAKRLRLGDEVTKGIMIAAYLHDLGKVRVKKNILQKTRKLSLREYFIIQKHPTWGVELLEGIEFPWEVKPLIRYHQEKWDGSGYPEGLKAEKIPIGARIIAVADMFDALTTDRPYRKALPLKTSLRIMKREAGMSIDATIARKFLRIVEEKFPLELEGKVNLVPFSAFVKLWNKAPDGNKKGQFLRREADLSSLVEIK
jgi:putative nucleotidyltransferase with HDIG domain